MSKIWRFKVHDPSVAFFKLFATCWKALSMESSLLLGGLKLGRLKKKPSTHSNSCCWACFLFGDAADFLSLSSGNLAMYTSSQRPGILTYKHQDNETGISCHENVSGRSPASIKLADRTLCPTPFFSMGKVGAVSSAVSTSIGRVCPPECESRLLCPSVISRWFELCDIFSFQYS